MISSQRVNVTNSLKFLVPAAQVAGQMFTHYFDKT